MLVWFILFVKSVWVILASGLFFRIALGMAPLSKFSLLCVPLLDLTLLVTTVVDLNSGNPAEVAHGLASIYLGFTVIYWCSIIHLLDSNLSYKLYSDLNPTKLDYGWSYAKYEVCSGLKSC
jgi:hypothetical protein